MICIKKQPPESDQRICDEETEAKRLQKYQANVKNICAMFILHLPCLRSVNLKRPTISVALVCISTYPHVHIWSKLCCSPCCSFFLFQLMNLFCTIGCSIYQLYILKCTIHFSLHMKCVNIWNSLVALCYYIVKVIMTNQQYGEYSK
jgi:hypothetical protein